MNCTKNFVSLVLNNIFKILFTFKLQILLVIAFIVFVIKNGSIVLGDKTNHESTFHPTQLLYLFLFCFLNLPLTPTQYISNFFSTLKNKKLAFIVMLIVSVLIVYKFTFVHKFILADNRHYIFYIWKNFYARFSQFKFLMTPIYSFSAVFILNLFKGGFSQMKIFILFITSCLVLIPAGLVEFRYFTNTLVFLIIELSKTSEFNENTEEKQENNEKQVSGIYKLIPNSLIVNIGVQIILNIILLVVFIFLPFKGPDGNIARFMF